MIKCINIEDLKVGMYIHNLNCDWMEHPFFSNHFSISSEHDIEKIIRLGIHEVYIDTKKGADVIHAPTEQEVQERLEREMHAIALQKHDFSIKYSVAEEFSKAKKVYQEANKIVHDILNDARIGKQIEVQHIEPIVEEMTASILRNSGALLALCRIKDSDNYTFLHSVSVGALLLTFCHALKMNKDVFQQAGMGGMLHDIGKMKVPDSILNKPNKLDEQELKIMKCHVTEGKKILKSMPDISSMTIMIASQHHERHDGSGYPEGLKGAEISQLGQMAAIVDVYDALTSNRCYHKGMPPTDALRKIYEWSKFHFNPDLVQAFIRTIGIYPVGSLVRLESGLIGVVAETNHSNLVLPTVNAFFDIKNNRPITPQTIDLSRSLGHGGGDRIIKHEAAENWPFDPLRFL